MSKKLFDISFNPVKSQGSYLFDNKSNSFYLDLFSFYSSLPLGYNHPIFDETFQNKALKYINTKFATNTMYCDEYDEFIKVFTKYTFSKNIHFTCTGALAVESAIKTAMHYKKAKNPYVIAAKNSFHGVNSWGFATDRVGVNIQRLRYFPENNWLHLSLDEIEQYLLELDTSNLVAIIIEPIQCTNGDIYLDVDKLKQISKLCKEKNICFILDEIQTGFGTTGKMWYYEHIGIVPDILIFGKKSQVSGICITDKYMEILDNPYQKLAVTFDGDMLDIIRSLYILKAYEKYNILSCVTSNCTYFKDALSLLTINYRSIGHLIAFDFTTSQERDTFWLLAFKHNLLINKAGDLTIRIRPNLAISDKEKKDFIDTIKGLHEQTTKQK